MGNAIAFDTLAYAKRLKKAGFTDEQAEVQAEAMAELIDERLATKEDVKNSELALRRDVKEMETSIQRDMKEMETSIQRDMKEMETRIQRDMKELEMRLIIRLGAMMAASIAIVAVLVKLL
mgnify:CR=1 FL=1